MTVHTLVRPERGSRNVLGVTVAGFGWEQALSHLCGLLRDRTFTKIGFLNAHSANVAFSNGEFFDALEDFLVLADGIGIDIAGRILYGTSFPANLNGTDFVPALLRASRQKLRVAIVGATSENLSAAIARMAADAPLHEYAAISDGFFDTGEEPRILAALEALHPDILLVAMGVPRQELWIERNITPAHCTLPIAVGALLDFLSGSVERAPMWMRRMRLEWIFRLILEPGRLWRRYVVGNPLFLARVLRQRLAMRRAGP